jgi:hypothetical protein
MTDVSQIIKAIEAGIASLPGTGAMLHQLGSR